MALKWKKEMTVRTIKLALLGLGFSTLMVTTGCAETVYNVERVPVPAPGHPDNRRYEQDRPKPLPEDATLLDRVGREIPPPPFEDAPLVNQRAPEQGKFELAYRSVGRPRITVFVNRTLDGHVIPAGVGEVERETNGRRVTGGPGQHTEEIERTRLKSGEYDEAYAKSLDYEAMENILTDFLACQGAVEIISPSMLRQKLTAEQIKDLQAGNPKSLRELADALNTDVLVQVSVHPTRQTSKGLEIRIVGEAINVKGGQQIGRAMVDMPAPLEKTTLNRYTRWVGRKLMFDMTQTWGAAEPSRPDPARQEGPRPEAPRPEFKPEAPRPEVPKAPEPH